MASNGLEERIEWIRKWAAENPTGTVKEAREALRAQFGTTMSTDTLAKELREARAAGGSFAFALLGNSVQAMALMKFIETMRAIGSAVKLNVVIAETRFELRLEGDLAPPKRTA